MIPWYFLVWDLTKLIWIKSHQLDSWGSWSGMLSSCPLWAFVSLEPLWQHSAMPFHWPGDLGCLCGRMGKANSLCVGGITAAITCQDHTVLLSPPFGSLSLFLPKLFLLARAVSINFKIVLCSISGILECLNPVSSKEMGWYTFA